MICAIVFIHVTLYQNLIVHFQWKTMNYIFCIYSRCNGNKIREMRLYYDVASFLFFSGKKRLKVPPQSPSSARSTNSAHLISLSTSLNLSRKMLACFSWNVRAGRKRMARSPQPPDWIPIKKDIFVNSEICLQNNNLHSKNLVQWICYKNFAHLFASADWQYRHGDQL